MAGRSSARPQDLKTFSTQAGGVTADLRTWITKLTASYQQFQSSASLGKVTSGTVETTLPELVTRQQDMVTFVDLVRVAFENADSGSLGNGVVSVSDTELQATYERIARANGLDPATFDLTPGAITVPPATTGAIPETSGFVDDPVCTATGHFLEDETDLAVPERLAVLAWPRRYCSRLLDAGAFGRGWFTWASARLVVDSRGDAAYHGPDGRQLVFSTGEDGWSRVPGIGAQVSAVDGGGLDLTWDAGTTFDLQRWRFGADGRLVTVSGPLLGTTTFHHDDDRLVRLVHEGGRSLDLRWEGERIVEATLSDGRTVHYAYDGAGDLVAVERPGGGRRYEPDEQGRIRSVHDADGVRLCLNTYDGEGRVLRQVSPLGRETVFEYLPGRITRISDTTGGPVAIYEHDATGRVTGLISAKGDRFERTFDDRGRVVRQRHFDGTTLERVPTADDGTVELAGSDGGWERWRYDDAGRLVAHEGSDDRTVTFAYEGGSLLPSRITGADGSATVIEWRDGQPVVVTDADGVRVEIGYDADGCAVRVENALGAVTEIEHHVSGPASVIRHPDGAEHHLGWDDAGCLTSVRDPSGAEGRLRYSPAGRIVAAIDPEGGRTDIAYGPAGMVDHITDALGRTGELRFDVLGNLVGVTEANGGKWEYDWSVLGQLSLVHAPDGSTMSINHDPEGRVAEVIDPLGGITRPADVAAGPDADPVTRTPAGRVAAVTDRSGHVSTYGYDAAGRIATVTGPDGGAWRYEHDERDRVVTAVSPEGRRTGYGHDAAGRVTHVEAGGSRRRFRYDRCGRLVAVIDPLGATTRYRYDAAGQLVAATDPRGVTVEYRYDELGDQVETIDPFGASTRTVRDVMGRPVEQRDPLGRVTAWSYDAAGTPVAVTLPTGERIAAEPPAPAEPAPAALSWARDEAGRVTARRGPGGRRQEHRHDAAGRLIGVTDSRFGTVELTRDRDGLLTGLQAAGLRRGWAYDDAGRLVDYAERTVMGSRRARLRRDAAGRVVEVREQTGTGPGAAERVTAYAYDPAGQLVAVRDAAGEHTFAYDPAGRLVAETGPAGSRRLAYDAAGQLVSLNLDTSTTTFAYDAAGRRTAETGGGRERAYRWGGRNELREIVHNGRVTRVDVSPTGELAAVDGRVLCWDTSATVSRPVQLGDDHVLTVAGLVVATATGDDPGGPISWCSADWRGSVVARDAWGRPEAGDATLALGFGGEVELGGLVWLRHRVLDPFTGQFLSRDPLSGVGGTPVATFPYHYAGNDPIGLVDPLGLQPVSIDQYNQIRDRATDVQWGNIVTAVIVVAGAAATILCPATAALWVGLAFGAASGAAPHLTNAMVYGDDIDWATLGKDIAIGAAFGALGGGVGGWAGKTAAKVAAGEVVPAFSAGAAKVLGTWTGEIGQGAVNGFAVSSSNELYDTTSLPGSRRDAFDWAAVVDNTAAGAGGGGLGKGVKTARGGHGPAGAMPDGSGTTIEAPPGPLAIEAPPVRLAIEAPPPRPAIEAAPPPPPANHAPAFSSPPEVQTPPPGGPQGNPDPVFSSPPEVQTPPPGAPLGNPNPVFQEPGAPAPAG